MLSLYETFRFYHISDTTEKLTLQDGKQHKLYWNFYDQDMTSYLDFAAGCLGGKMLSIFVTFGEGLKM